MRRPSERVLRVSGLLEAVAAVAIALAFWGWYRGSLYRSTAAFRVVLAVVAGLTLFAIGHALYGDSPGEPRRSLRWRRAALGLGTLLAAWFVAIDWRWSWEECAACHDRRDVFEYRVFGFPAWRDVGGWDQPTLIEWVAEDLGVPCPHDRIARRTKHRMMGLCLLVEDGGSVLGGAPWYPPCARAAVRSWRETDPAIAATFRERVLEKGDWEYWRSLIRRLYEACANDDRPEHPIPAEKPPPASSADSR